MMMNRRSSKRVNLGGDYNVSLILKIYQAEGIDNPSKYPSVIDRIYRVVFWVHPDKEFLTDRAVGTPDPIWNNTYHIEFGKSDDLRFLYVEVLRYASCSETNPGTSTGLTLVGRAKIPLPKLSRKKAGRYGLVRLEDDGSCTAEGHIVLSMELEKTYMYSYEG